MFKEEAEHKNLMFEINHGRKPCLKEKIEIYVSILARRFKYQLKETAAVLSGKKLADNKQYEGASRVDQQSVEAEPRRWIIEECIPACKILWDKNIYTFMCSDGLDRNAWIELELENLSAENKGILEQIKKEYECYQYHSGCINIAVSGKGAKASQELIKIANRFVMQDVPAKYATISRDNLLIKCGCYKEIPNPKYVSLEKQLENMTFEDWGKPIEPETLYVLDESKINKPVEEYIEDAGAILDMETGIIYRNKFHFDKHIKYLEYKRDLGGMTKGLI